MSSLDACFYNPRRERSGIWGWWQEEEMFDEFERSIAMCTAPGMQMVFGIKHHPQSLSVRNETQN